MPLLHFCKQMETEDVISQILGPMLLSICIGLTTLGRATQFVQV